MNHTATKSMSPKEFFSKYAIYVILVGMCILITVFRPQFISPSNIFGVLSATCVYGCMALGMTLIIISGGIDLAAGSIVAFSGVCGAMFGQMPAAADKIFPGLGQMPFLLPVIITLGAGLICGLINGTLIAKFNTPPFIVTLGMTTVVRGATLLMTGGEPVSNLIPGYSTVGGKIADILPVSVLIFAVMIALSAVLLGRTRFGFDTYAIGSNRHAAEVSGVKVPGRIIQIYAFGGLMFAVAGLIVTGRAASIHPGAAVGYELTACSAAFIGGCSPSGGVGLIRNTVIGALIISVLRNGLTLLGIDSYWQQIAEGLVIIVAVAMDLRRTSAGK